jgi:toxin-antitoxin system PIN domain toxin
VFVADTNLLVYAADRDAPEHERCREIVLRWRAQPAPWHLTWGIAYEFLRVATHPRVLRRQWAPQDALGFLNALFASPALSLLGETDRHASVLRDLIDQVPRLTGNLLHGAHTVALMREHGVRMIYTRDADFHRFPGVEVRDPLASPR